MSSLTPIPEVSLPVYPLLERYQNQTSPKDGFIFAICPICSKVQEDVLVSKKLKLQKMIFCSSNCAVIFQTNVVMMKSEKK